MLKVTQAEYDWLMVSQSHSVGNLWCEVTALEPHLASRQSDPNEDDATDKQKDFDREREIKDEMDDEIDREVAVMGIKGHNGGTSNRCKRKVRLD
jgi:hypothetical protein